MRPPAVIYSMNSSRPPRPANESDMKASWLHSPIHGGRPDVLRKATHRQVVEDSGREAMDHELALSRAIRPDQKGSTGAYVAGAAREESHDLASGRQMQIGDAGGEEDTPVLLCPSVAPESIVPMTCLECDVTSIGVEDGSTCAVAVHSWSAVGEGGQGAEPREITDACV